jgi:hypothetical protein
MMVLFIVTAVRTSSPSTRVASFAAFSSLKDVQIKEDEMEGVCSTYGKDEIA